MKQSILAAAALSLSALLHPITAHADNSSVNVATESGIMHCAIQTNDAVNRGNLVVCQGYTPEPEGNLAVITANGSFYRLGGNLSPWNGPNSSNYTVLQYGQTYHFLGWTVYPDETGTRFSNDATGHGMRISVDVVNAF